MIIKRIIKRIFGDVFFFKDNLIVDNWMIDIIFFVDMK